MREIGLAFKGTGGTGKNVCNSASDNDKGSIIAQG